MPAEPARRKKLVIRGLSYWTDAQAFLERFDAAAARCPAPKPKVLWFQQGTAPVKPQGGVAAAGSGGAIGDARGFVTVWCETAQAADVITGAFDGVALSPHAPDVVARVETAPNQLLTLVESQGWPDLDLAPASVDPAASEKPPRPSAPADYLQDAEFLNFVAGFEKTQQEREARDITKGEANVTQSLEAWLADQARAAATATAKPTPLVDAVVGNWFYGQAFPWELEQQKEKAAAARRKLKAKGIKGKFLKDSDDDDDVAASAAASSNPADHEAKLIEDRRRKREQARPVAEGGAALSKKELKRQKKAAKKKSASTSVESTLLKQADKEHQREVRLAEKAALKAKRKSDRAAKKERKARQKEQKEAKAASVAAKQADKLATERLARAISGNGPAPSPTMSGKSPLSAGDGGKSTSFAAKIGGGGGTRPPKAAGGGAGRGGGGGGGGGAAASPAAASPTGPSAAPPPKGFTVSRARDKPTAKPDAPSRGGGSHVDPDADVAPGRPAAKAAPKIAVAKRPPPPPAS